MYLFYSDSTYVPFWNIGPVVGSKLSHSLAYDAAEKPYDVFKNWRTKTGGKWADDESISVECECNGRY